MRNAREPFFLSEFYTLQLSFRALPLRAQQNNFNFAIPHDHPLNTLWKTHLYPQEFDRRDYQLYPCICLSLESSFPIYKEWCYFVAHQHCRNVATGQYPHVCSKCIVHIQDSCSVSHHWLGLFSAVRKGSCSLEMLLTFLLRIVVAYLKDMTSHCKKGLTSSSDSHGWWSLLITN